MLSFLYWSCLYGGVHFFSVHLDLFYFPFPPFGLTYVKVGFVPTNFPLTFCRDASGLIPSPFGYRLAKTDLCGKPESVTVLLVLLILRNFRRA